MIGERARQPGESDESWTAHCSLVATLSLRAILATPEGREALKALLTEDGPLEAAAAAVEATRIYAISHPSRRYLMVNAADEAYDTLAAAVDALDSPKGDT